MNVQLQTKVKTSPKPFGTPPPTGVLQRKCVCGGAAGLTGECEDCRNKRLTGQTRPLLQTKLTISRPGDKYEQEADRVADMVMRIPESSVQRQVKPDEEQDKEVIQRKPVSAQITPFIQRQLDSEEEEVEEETGQAKTLVQRRGTNQASSALPPIVYDVLHSPGQPLDADTRAFMESRFGHDFSRVRVHTDVKAAESARLAKAQAYTMGHEIVVGANAYIPHTTPGKKLLAHELTHVVQQQNQNPHSPRLQRQPVPDQSSRSKATSSQTGPRRLDDDEQRLLREFVKRGRVPPYVPETRTCLTGVRDEDTAMVGEYFFCERHGLLSDNPLEPYAQFCAWGPGLVKVTPAFEEFRFGVIRPAFDQLPAELDCCGRPCARPTLEAEFQDEFERAATFAGVDTAWATDPDLWRLVRNESARVGRNSVSVLHRMEKISMRQEQ